MVNVYDGDQTKTDKKISMITTLSVLANKWASIFDVSPRRLVDARGESLSMNHWRHVELISAKNRAKQGSEQKQLNKTQVRRRELLSMDPRWRPLGGPLVPRAEFLTPVLHHTGYTDSLLSAHWLKLMSYFSAANESSAS